MTDDTIAPEAAPQQAGPVQAAVEAVEVLAAAHEAGREQGQQEGAAVAMAVAQDARIAALEGQVSEMRGLLAMAAETAVATAGAVEMLNARLAQEQEAHEEAAEVVADVAEEALAEEAAEAEEVQPEPARDNTPTRKRKWA